MPKIYFSPFTVSIRNANGIDVGKLSSVEKVSFAFSIWVLLSGASSSSQIGMEEVFIIESGILSVIR